MENTPDWYRKHFPKQAQDADKIYNKLDKSGWIKNFRKGWNLPDNGCSNNLNFQKWYFEAIIKPTNNLLADKFFIEKQAEIKKKRHGWVDGKITLNDIEKYQLQISLKIPNFKFDYDIQSIMTQLKIPQQYEAFVHDSLVYKQKLTTFPLDKEFPKIEFSIDPNTRRKRLFIEVYADTKIKDFKSKSFQETFKKYQKKLYDFGTIRQIGVKNPYKAEEIYHLHHVENKSYKEIKRLTGIKDVATILKRYKKRLGVGARKKQK